MIRQVMAFCGLLAAVGVARAEAPAARWINDGGAPMPVVAKDAPKQPVFLQVGPNGRPFRILPATPGTDGLHLDIPPHARVELWDRPELAHQMTPFGTAARWGALPGIVVGPTIPVAGQPGAETAPWSTAAGRFRAYPNGEISLSVTVRNDGLGLWTHPRVEIFAPEDWTVTPKVAEALSHQRTAPSAGAPSVSAGQRGVLPPTVTGTATFTIRIPETVERGLPYPIIAFLRFNTVGETLTVQNSVDVTVEPPVALRYGMNEAGTRFVTRIENRFAPAVLGDATVTVSPPEGSGWKVTQAGPVSVAKDVSATAETAPAPMTDKSLRMTVTTKVAGSMLAESPMIFAVARYDGRAALEEGVRALPGGAASEAGLGFPAGGAERALGFDVDADFAVSDPATFVSPTWVTVALENRGATRARLEYDAFGSAAPAVAGDVPITNTQGRATLTFLLPDARFEGNLPGGGDLRLVLNGDAAVARIAVSKWNADMG